MVLIQIHNWVSGIMVLAPARANHTKRWSSERSSCHRNVHLGTLKETSLLIRCYYYNGGKMQVGIPKGQLTVWRRLLDTNLSCFEISAISDTLVADISSRCNQVQCIMSYCVCIVLYYVFPVVSIRMLFCNQLRVYV